MRKGYTVCDCCSLRCPSPEMTTWNQRTLSRRLKVLGPGLDTDEPSVGPYRSYYVDHQHQVCFSCRAHLAAGGEFQAIGRNAGKLAVLVLAGVLVLLILAMPFIMPHLLSALWLGPGEGGR